MQPGTTTVTIYGQDYTVRSDGDAEYVRGIAAYVDARMREVAQNSNQVTSLRVAILAALNITDELFRAREVGAGEAESLRDRAGALAARLEAIILEHDGAPGTVAPGNPRAAADAPVARASETDGIALGGDAGDGHDRT